MTYHPGQCNIWEQTWHETSDRGSGYWTQVACWSCCRGYSTQAGCTAILPPTPEHVVLSPIHLHTFWTALQSGSDVPTESLPHIQTLWDTHLRPFFRQQYGWTYDEGLRRMGLLAAN